jgi:hypothetical protein
MRGDPQELGQPRRHAQDHPMKRRDRKPAIDKGTK